MSTVAVKTPRLPAAAKEFNVGMATIVEALAAKGFTVAASPVTKLTEEQYDVLVSLYAKDRDTKQRSEQIQLVKGEPGARRDGSKPAPTPALPKADPAPVKKEEPAPLAPAPEPVAETPAPTPSAPAREPGPKPTPEAEPDVPRNPYSEPIPEPKRDEPTIQAPVGEPAAAASQAAASAPLTTAAKVAGPNVVGKIDLDSLTSTGKPKKATKKSAASTKETAPVKATAKKKGSASDAEAAQPDAVSGNGPAVPVPVVADPAPPQPVAAIPTPPPAEESKPEHIEMKAPQLTGPKILGKIDLPAGGDAGGRRTRQRIPIAKRPDTFRPGGADRIAGSSTGRTSGVGSVNGRPDRRPGQGGQGGGTGPDGQGVDKKAIQDRLRATQAKLSGGRGGKGAKARDRRDKRNAAADKRAQQDAGGGQTLQVTEFISVSELANLLDVSFAEVISKCMSLGIMVSINQRLDAEVIELVASEFGHEVEFINLDQTSEEFVEVEDDDADLQPRAPIVTIMGHVDHGKTSLLDYIRAANVVAGEAGGITQHIGAYQVKTASEKRITFLDTPGHEAFTAMRARGAKVADVAVIVISADDAIMPQTREAISHAQAAGLPMIFALNKIDKEGANPEKIREQLAGMNILVEEWGGKFQSQEISAKKGLNVDALLEKIGLESEILDLKANPDRDASGSVIEAALDKGRGYISTVLVQNGTLNQGDMVVCGQYYGKIRAMFNERGQRVEVAGPSAPVQVLGLNGAPQAGEKFRVYENEDEAKEVANHRAQILREQGIRARKHLTLEEIGRRLALGNFKELPVIIKGDFDGSVEALSDSLQKLSTPEVAVNVVHRGVGAVTESDINLAAASDAIIIGFQVRPTAQAAKLAEQENIEVRFYSIIYDAINEIKSSLEGLLEPTVERRTVCNVEVREVFKISGVGSIAGCYVTDGKITRNTKINIIRDSIVVFTGELSSLKRFKDDAKEVAAGYECGMMIKNYNDIRTGDIIEGYEEVQVKRTLS